MGARRRAGQSVTGRVAYNAERLDHAQAGLGYFDYLGTADFWERTLQNWQSEFLAVGPMAILPSTCASAARRSQNRSARRTTPPARPAERNPATL